MKTVTGWYRLLEGDPDAEGADGGTDGEEGGEGSGEDADVDTSVNDADTAAPTTAEIARARQMGWTPREQFKGNPRNFVSARDYIKRGEQVLPLVQAENRRLRQATDATSAEVLALREQLTGAQESIAALTEIQSTSTATGLKAERMRLMTARQQARKDQDDALELSLDEQIEELTGRIAKTSVAKPKPVIKPTVTNQPDPTQDPVYMGWRAENSWFGTDIPRSDYANAVAVRIGKEEGIKGRELLDRVASEVESVFGPISGARRNSKAEGHNGGGGGGGGSSGDDTLEGQSYNDLPRDAKEACMRSSKRVVGEKGSGRAFLTLAAYQKHYAKMFFNS